MSESGADTPPLAAATTGNGDTQPMASASAMAGMPPGGYGRDRDPPPGYDGIDPETTFRVFEKNLKLWQFETDVPVQKQGAKLLRTLTGVARMAVEELEYEQIASEDGIKNILQRLREYFTPHLEVSLPRAFETAVYGTPRQNKETYGEYVHRMQRSFALLAKEGVQLPEGAKGYIIYRQSSLSEAHEQRVQTWCEGSYQADVIIRSLRKLDKVIRDRGSKSHYVMDSEEANSTFMGNIPDNEQEMEETDEEYIYVSHGDLDVIYDEKDMVEALASYQQVRQQLKEQKLSRGFYPKKGFQNYGKGKGHGKDFGKVKVHREQLKLRTRCWRCHQIGHVSAECTVKPSGSEASSAKNPSQASNSTSGKTGFFVASGDKTILPAVNPPDVVADTYWLREFVEQRAKTHGDDSVTSEDYGAGSDSDPSKRLFCGIVTNSFEGVVDTAAEGGLIGATALKKLEQHLVKHNLRCVWTPKTSAAKGVGGSAKVCGVVLIPIALGGISGVLETTVVEGDVPFLLPIKLLKMLGAIVNLPRNTLTLEKHGVDVPMRELPSGHVVIQIDAFEDGKFECPPELANQFDFGMNEKHTVEAMLVQSERRVCGPTFQSTRVVPQVSNGWPVRPSAGFGKCAPSNGSQASFTASHAKEPQFGKGTSKLASDPGQDLHGVGHGRAAKRNRRLVPAAVAAGVVATVGANCPGHLCGVDSHRQAVEAFANKGSTFSLREFMHSSLQGTQGRWQQERFMDHVPGMQLPLGEPLQSHRTPPRGEREQGLLAAGGVGHGCGDHGYGGLFSGHRERSNECHVHGRGPQAVHGSLHADSATSAGNRDGGQPGSRIVQGQHASPTDGDGAEEDGAAHAGEGLATAGNDEDADGQQDLVNGFMGSCECCGTRGELGVGMDGGSHSCPKPQDGQAGGDVQVSGPSGAVRGEEGRSSEGSNLLEVREEAMRPVFVGQDPHQQPDEGESKEECQGNPGGGLDRRSRPLSGTWALCATGKTRTWARRLQRTTLQGSSMARFTAERKYQMKDEEGNWQERTGFVPSQSNAEIRVWISANARLGFEDDFEGGREVSFTAKQRKLVMKHMEELSQKPSVAEVFSPPRVNAVGKQLGFQDGGNFDLQTGWDLRQPRQRAEMWKHLKRAQPTLVILCPPCTMFSKLQELNYPKMDGHKVLVLLAEAVDHVELAALVAEWQVRQGRYFVYEHPDGAYSWLEPCVQRMMSLTGATRIKMDMCMFGMNVDGTGLNRKPTGIVSNCPGILRHLDVRCDGTHFHTPLVGGKAKHAQVYPTEFCKAILLGLYEQLLEDGRIGSQEILAIEVEAVEEDEQQLQLVPVEAGEKDDGGIVTQEDKNAVMKLHRNVGHPQLPELIRFMRAGRVRAEVVRWAAKEFECDVCKSKQHPKAARPAAIPKSFQPNKVLGVDLIYIPEVGGNGTFPALSMLDWGTNYQMVERVDFKNPMQGGLGCYGFGVVPCLWTTRGDDS